MPTYGLGEFVPAGISGTNERTGDYAKNRSSTSCFGRDKVDNLAYIPEHDLRGVPVTASHPLKRFEAGPYAGKIVVDSRETIFNAIANQVENAAQLLRSGPPDPTFVYVIGFANPNASDALKSLASLQQLANDPSGLSYDSSQPTGLAILTDEPDAFWPAFQRIRQHIVEHATLHAKQ
jgi:hypothetical protein